MERKSNKHPGGQGAKFIEAARKAGASEDAADFDRMLGKIAKAPPPASVQERKTKKPAK